MKKKTQTIYPVTPQAVQNAKNIIDKLYQEWINGDKKDKPQINYGYADKKRTNKQNNLQHKWYAELEQQGEMSALHFGLPIICESPQFAEMIDEKIYSLPYETQLDVMGKPPFPEFAVTRMMTKEQKQRFLNNVYNYWTMEKGYDLTDPMEQQLCMR